MNEDIMTTAVASMAIGIIGKIIWDWLKGGRNEKPKGSACALADEKVLEISKSLRNSEIIMERMKEIHSKQDDSGRPLWYTPSKTIEQIDAIDDSTKNIQLTLTLLLEEIKATNVAIIAALKRN